MQVNEGVQQHRDRSAPGYVTGDIFYLEQILCYLKPAQFHGNYWDYFRQLRNLITTEKKNCVLWIY